MQFEQTFSFTLVVYFSAFNQGLMFNLEQRQLNYMP